MNAIGAVVLSERRLLVDSLTHLVNERLGLHCATAESGQELGSILESNPEVLVIVDLESPGLEPQELRTALAPHLGRRCGVYDHFTARIAERAFDLGVGVPVSLSSSIGALQEAIGGTRATNVVTAVGPTRRDVDHLAQLSARELEVLTHIARGDTSVRIAAVLGITPHTVDTHRRRAMRKLGASNQSQAVALLARVGALTTPRGDGRTATVSGQ